MTDFDINNSIRLIEELLNNKNSKNVKDPLEIIRTAIYLNPEQFDYISPGNFTKEEYKELKEFAEFLKI
jgi:hypothetical protein